MDQASEKPVDIDNCLYSRNDKVLEHMSRNIDDYFKKHLGLSPDDAERLHKDYSQQYGQAIEGLVRHHQIDALEYNAKVDDAVPLDDLIKPNAQLRQFLEDIDTSKMTLIRIVSGQRKQAGLLFTLWRMDFLYLIHQRLSIKFAILENCGHCIPSSFELEIDTAVSITYLSAVSVNLLPCRIGTPPHYSLITPLSHASYRGATPPFIIHLETLTTLQHIGSLTNPIQNGQKWTKAFRAIWIQGNDFDEVKLSGVAAYAWNDKDLISFVPVNPRGR
ncbi:pyrimidine 5 -nucleotidase [Fusarium oxysporum f. sp. phaseoli]